jgi:hypothetical protein
MAEKSARDLSAIEAVAAKQTLRVSSAADIL